jgi:hypothetical protein
MFDNLKAIQLLIPAIFFCSLGSARNCEERNGKKIRKNKKLHLYKSIE